MRILSGIQPSGTVHIGNYFGMIHPVIQSQNEGELFAFIASYHALTSVQEKEKLQNSIFDIAVNFLALGMDPQQSTFWVQHHVKEVMELYWILSNYTPMGLVERAHSYKDKVSKGIHANHGLFSYPILMAADILLYDSQRIPVGRDQIQHIEITRDIANRFNHKYGEVFTLPDAYIDNKSALVPGTNGEKMSKSYNNTISMFGNPKSLKKEVMSIVTDSKGLDEPKSYQECTIYKLSQLFMNEEELEELRQRYETPGEGYGHFKLTLLESITNYFQPYEEKRNYYMNHPKEVEEILHHGASKARKIAQAKMETIRELVGIA